MALEIERRFLVHGESWRNHVQHHARLQQGYLSPAGEGLTVRVRLSRSAGGETAAWLTLKLPGADARSRFEFEYPIPIEDGEALLALTPRQVGKTRYALNLPGGEWVLDVFEGANAPLVVAEVELTHAEADLDLPPWCVVELTDRGELNNAALAYRPLQSWPAPEREALLAGGAGTQGRPGNQSS